MVQQVLYAARVYMRKPRGNLLIVRLEGKSMSGLLGQVRKLQQPPDTVVEIIAVDRSEPTLCYVSDLSTTGIRFIEKLPNAPERPVSRDSLEFAATAEFAGLCERHRERGVLTSDDCQHLRDIIEHALARTRPQ